MQVRPEVWPLAADRQGIWLLSGGEQWKAVLPVDSDGSVHADVEGMLTENGVDTTTATGIGGDAATRHELSNILSRNNVDKLSILHSTSWRQDGPFLVLTYFAVVEFKGDFVRGRWPQAQPVSPLLPAAVGRPLPHNPADPPTVRDVDVLLHGLRHLAFLRMYDADAAAAIERNRYLAEGLEGLKPSLAGMYRRDGGLAA